MKILGYTVLDSETQFDLIKAVKSSLQNGWQPLGAAFAVNDPNVGFKFCQTLVIYEEVQDNPSECEHKYNLICDHFSGLIKACSKCETLIFEKKIDTFACEHTYQTLENEFTGITKVECTKCHSSP